MLFLQNGNVWLKNLVYKTHTADLVTGPVVKLEEKYKLIIELKCKDLSDQRKYMARKKQVLFYNETWKQELFCQIVFFHKELTLDNYVQKE